MLEHQCGQGFNVNGTSSPSGTLLSMSAQAYTASKPCNLLTARALAVQPEAHEKDLTVIAYDPGPTPGTKLSRSYAPPMRAAWWLLGTPVGRLVPSVASPGAAGALLADLTLGRTRPPTGEYYAKQRRGRATWLTPSQLARNNDARDALWRNSASLAGLTSAV
jgi:NAD(P)-dependent dehydrogenase (short-subunit alcohol dehydrogenase family)